MRTFNHQRNIQEIDRVMKMVQTVKSELERIRGEVALSYIYRRGHALYLNGQVTILSRSSSVYDFSVDDQYNDFNLRVESVAEVLYNCSCGSSGICPHKVGGLLQMLEELSHQEAKKELPGIAYTREGMIKRVMQERVQKAKKAKYELHLAENIYGEHLLLNEKRKEYKITFHDFKKEIGYCTCPDFTGNKLGTCKHLMWSFAHLKKNADQLKALNRDYPFVEVFLDPLNHYQISWFFPGRIPDPEISSLLYKYFGKSMIYPDQQIKQFLGFLRSAKQFKQLLVRPEVYRKVEKAFNQEVLADLKQKTRLDYSLLKVKLYKFQEEGVRFATFKEGAIIADEIGLGKTYQAIASAVFKQQIFSLKRCLIICPASLMDQWKELILRVSGAEAIIVKGTAQQRKEIYQNTESYFLITNYEKIAKDRLALENHPPDFLVLDEAQRVKNYETQTAGLIRGIKHKHILALSGTPIDNKLTDLYSIVSFVDPSLLAPLWEFSQMHYYFDPDHEQKITGYYNLDLLKEKLSGILIRRTKQLVKKQLADVTEINFPVVFSPQQRKLQKVFTKELSEILERKFLSPFDWQKIFQLITKLRMLCDSTLLLGADFNSAPKLEELKKLLVEKLDINSSKRKVVIFSEWVKMNHQICKVLRANGIEYVELNGSVPVDKRKELIDRFNDSDACQVFVSTETGGAGLNLQAADTIINFDLPLSVVKKEQRLGRIDRLGQKHAHLTIINMIMRNSFEAGIAAGFQLKENLMASLESADLNAIDVTVSHKLTDELRSIIASLEEGSEVYEDTALKLEFEDSSWQPYEVTLAEEVLVEAEEVIDEQNDLLKSITGAAASVNELGNTADDLSVIAADGLRFFAGLFKMATGKEVLQELPEVSMDNQEQELTIKFKLKKND